MKGRKTKERRKRREKQKKMPVATTKKGKSKLNLGSGGRTPKRPKAVTTTLVPHTPNTSNNIALLDEKLKDHYEDVWASVEETQQEMLSGFAEVRQITKYMKQTIRARLGVVETSCKEKVKGT